MQFTQPATSARSAWGKRALGAYFQPSSFTISLIQYFFDTPDFTTFQSDFDTMTVHSRFCQNVFHHTFGPVAGSLILLQRYQDLRARFDIFTFHTVHLSDLSFVTISCPPESPSHPTSRGETFAKRSPLQRDSRSSLGEGRRSASSGINPIEYIEYFED